MPARPRPDVVDGADLVEVVRARLVAAGCEDGVLGQIALLLAERITAPEASGVVALARELQRVLDEALLEAELTAETAAAPAPGDGPDDEVAAARRRMEDKLQAVVGDGGES